MVCSNLEGLSFKICTSEVRSAVLQLYIRLYYSAVLGIVNRCLRRLCNIRWFVTVGNKELLNLTYQRKLI